MVFYFVGMDFWEWKGRKIKMTTKEKLEKGCGKRFRLADEKYDYEITFCGKLKDNNVWLCPICQAKLQQHNEDLKMFEEIIDKTNIFKILMNSKIINESSIKEPVQNVEDRIKEELKQELKGDVKEFIRLLKEDLNPLNSNKEDFSHLTFKEQIKIIDTLAGERLV